MTLFYSENLLNEMQNKHAFDVYAFCKLNVNISNMDGNDDDDIQVNLIQDDYQKVMFRLVVAQVMLGVRYSSNIITLTKNQILQLKKRKEVFVIDEPPSHDK